MKTHTTAPNLVFARLLCLAALATASAVIFPQTAGAQAPDEDLGYDFQDGKSNKIARVISVTPTYVQVVHENGQSGRKIPRNLLPPELAAKYPYDMANAAEYRVKQAETAAQQAVALQAMARESVRRQEQQLANEISRLRMQAARLRGDLNLAKQIPGKKMRAYKTAGVLNELQTVRAQIAFREDQLKAFRARQ